MLALFSKDLLIAKIFLVIILPFYFLYAAIFFKVEGVFLLVNMIFTLFLAVGVTMVDDRYERDLFILSLPVTRATVVFARYLSSLTACILGLSLCIFYGLFLDLVIQSEKMNFDPVVTLEGLFAFLIFLSITISLFYPFYFRFGLWKGVTAFTSTLIILIMVVVSLMHLTGVLADVMGFYLSREFLRSPGLALIRGIIHAEEVMGRLFFLSAIAFMTSGLVLLSMKLSIRVYSRREF